MLESTMIQQITIPQNVYKICRDAFKNTLIEKIVIPDTVETIGENAFSFSTLKEIYLPKQLKELKKRTFYRTNIKELIIPRNCESIGYDVFDGNDNFKTIIFEGDLPKIDSEAFGYNTMIKNFVFKDPKAHLTGFAKAISNITHRVTICAPKDSTAYKYALRNSGKCNVEVLEIDTFDEEI